MSTYLNFLYNNFGLNLWLTLILSIIICIVILFIIIMLIILLLDSLYRPSTAKFKYNFLLDHLSPIIILMSPYYFIKFIEMDYLFVESLTYVIFMQIVIIVPLIHFWLDNRNWFSEQERGNFKTILGWNDPQLYFHISKAIIYPMVYLFYFSVIRYFRLGNKFNIYESLLLLLTQDNIMLCVLIIVALPNIFVWCMILINIFISVKNNIWESCSFLMYSIHLALLKYNPYFKFTEKIHKLFFIFFHLVSLNGSLMLFENHEGYDPLKHIQRYSYFRQLIHFSYHKPSIIYFFMFFAILLEIICCGQLFISYYLLFIIPLLNIIFKGFYYYGRSDFSLDVCKVDYLNGNIMNPRYPALFWFLIENPELFFGITLELSKDESKEWSKQYFIYINENQIFQTLRTEKLFDRITKKNTKRSWLMQVKTLYYKLNQVRWNNK